MKNLFLTLTLAVGLAGLTLGADAGLYHSDSLLATNTLVNGAAVNSSTTTNFVPANYYVSPNPNIIIPGNGVFEIKPTASGFIDFQAAYTQVTNDFTGGLFTIGQATNATLLVQPILDDSVLQNPSWTVTNSAIVSVPLTMMAVGSTNGVWLATARCADTNFLGARYAKLVGVTGIFTNSIRFRSIRAGYWPAAGY